MLILRVTKILELWGIQGSGVLQRPFPAAKQKRTFASHPYALVFKADPVFFWARCSKTEDWGGVAGAIFWSKQQGRSEKGHRPLRTKAPDDVNASRI